MIKITHGSGVRFYKDGAEVHGSVLYGDPELRAKLSAHLRGLVEAFGIEFLGEEVFATTADFFAYLATPLQMWQVAAEVHHGHPKYKLKCDGRVIQVDLPPGLVRRSRGLSAHDQSDFNSGERNADQRRIFNRVKHELEEYRKGQSLQSKFDARERFASPVGAFDPQYISEEDKRLRSEWASKPIVEMPASRILEAYAKAGIHLAVEETEEVSEDTTEERRYLDQPLQLQARILELRSVDPSWSPSKCTVCGSLGIGQCSKATEVSAAARKGAQNRHRSEIVKFPEGCLISKRLGIKPPPRSVIRASPLRARPGRKRK